MEPDLLQRLFTPSPVMFWLVMLLPLTITLSGVVGAAERHTGNRRLAVWAAVLTIWLVLPLTFADPVAAQVSAMASILAWLGLVAFWGRHVWNHWPSPVWAHALVITHLVAIAVGAAVAVIRLALS